MGTQVKLQAISSLLSNEHLQKIETNKPHTETWIYSQPHASNIVLSRFTGNPRIPVPVGHRCQWRHNHDGQGPLMSSIYSAVFCVIGTDSLARTAPRSSDFKTAVDFCLSCTRSMTWSRLRVW